MYLSVITSTTPKTHKKKRHNTNDNIHEYRVTSQFVKLQMNTFSNRGYQKGHSPDNIHY